jgi:hypothetical protein
VVRVVPAVVEAEKHGFGFGCHGLDAGNRPARVVGWVVLGGTVFSW